jgi:hypothetical protein
MRFPAADFRTHFGFRRRRDKIATFVVRTVPWPGRLAFLTKLEAV